MTPEPPESMPPGPTGPTELPHRPPPTRTPPTRTPPTRTPSRRLPALPIDPDVEAEDRIDVILRFLHPSRRVLRAIARRWDILLVIGLGGSLGAAARWGIGEAFPVPDGSFPWATFTVNVTGSLCLGAAMVFLTDVWSPSRYLRPFLGVGVLGGYTTFSTYMLELRDLSSAGHLALAAAYVLATLVAGLFAVWVGIVAARAAVTARDRRVDRSLDETADAAVPERDLT